MTRGYAGLVSRGIARAADLTLLAILVAGTSWLVAQFLGIESGHCSGAREWWNVRARLCGFMPWAVPVAGLVIPPAYRVAFYLTAGQTPGMAFVGLRLLRADGRPVRLRQAVKRVLAFSFTLGLGSVLVPVTERRRALHDILAGTVVVYDWGTHEADVRRAIEQARSADA